MLEENDKKQEDKDISEPPKPTESERSDRKVFTSEELSEIIAMWESGNYTLAQISEITGRSESVLSRKFKAANIEKGSKKKQLEEETAKRITEHVMSAAEELVKKHQEINKETGEQARHYQLLIQQELLEARKKNQAFNTRKGNIEVLNKALSGVKMAQDIRIVALGVPIEKIVDEESITNITIRKMDADEVAETQRSSSIQAGHIPEDDELPPDAPDMAEEEKKRRAEEKALAQLTTNTPSKLAEN